MNPDPAITTLVNVSPRAPLSGEIPVTVGIGAMTVNEAE
jgi:hypothetical protein